MQRTRRRARVLRRLARRQPPIRLRHRWSRQVQSEQLRQTPKPTRIASDHRCQRLPPTWIDMSRSNRAATRASRARAAARKRVSADVILRDDQNCFLLVNPSYKPDWDSPGGMAEANEPLIERARRELREELGLDISVGALLAVEWVPPHGPWDDTLVFIFDGGVLPPTAIEALTITDDEIAAFEFCSPAQAQERLRPYVWQRTAAALKAIETGRPQYRHRDDASS
jgi:8-oxo-dGTP pyrophosphatase MutT (NUDIX family)